MLPLAGLPRIDIVLQSHDHYDHFDRSAARTLAHRNPDMHWCVPLGMGASVRALGAQRVHELDWWGAEDITVRTSAGSVTARVSAVPARHFSGRGLTDRDRSLWCGWTISVAEARAYLAGDSGVHPQFGEIAERRGPFDLTILPIGAYEPRWFMSRVHMNPDEAVAAWRSIADVQQSLHRRPAPPMLGVHWGTYRLTDERMDEPPTRTRHMWRAHGLDESRLWILAHGETRRTPWLAAP
jgi:N-acyl-phosphatidylethanolamine-hydrolysing phospholipase D